MYYVVNDQLHTKSAIEAHEICCELAAIGTSFLIQWRDDTDTEHRRAVLPRYRQTS